MTAPIERLLILGGGSEIGVAFVDRCAQAGSLQRVVLAGRPGGSVDGAVAELTARHPGLAVVTAGFDATAWDQHSARLESIDSNLGPFDTVVVAFGQLGEPFTLDHDPAAAGDLAAMNFAGGVAATLAALAILRGEPNARLMVISSIAAVRTRITNAIYGSAKTGLDTFVRELAAPAAKVGVRVVCVRPGFVHTRMTEGLSAAPLATGPAEVAADMHKAALDHKATLVHSPAALNVLGRVLRALPGPIWRKVSAR